MNIIRLQLSKNSSLYTHLALAIGFAFTLLFLRMRITGSYYYLFLVWNLFLAGIPFAISQFLLANQKLRSHKIVSYIGFITWLLFLPNSPYIITDFVHLTFDGSNLMWLDILLVFTYALTGLILGLVSMIDMAELLSARYNPRIAKYVLFKVSILCGYGIYLGRFLRFNSWDITTKPGDLFLQIARSIYEPNVWLITIAFGGFLWILYAILQAINYRNIK